jgi:hypothetical protein
MRQLLRKLVGHGVWTCKRALLTSIAVVALGTASGVSPALANKAFKEEFLRFSDCPLKTASFCLYSSTTSGEFKIGLKTVPIDKTLVLQGGILFSLEEQSLIPAADGNTLPRVPLEVPGGLLGIAGLGGEVTATAEIAGPSSGVKLNASNLATAKGTAVTLPLKVKLDNPVLGEECYIGTDAEPIVLHLTTGTTSPPFPNQSISGQNGRLANKAKGDIAGFEGSSLVDNSFAVPGASGCGGSLSPVIDLAVDADVGLPAPAGTNTAVMNGDNLLAGHGFVEKYLPKKKKK